MCLYRFEHLVMGHHLIIDVSIQIWTLGNGTSFNHRKVRHFCITTTSQIIGAAAAAPAAPLSTPLYLYRFEHCNKSSLIHRCVYTDVNNFSKMICQSYSCVYKYLNTRKQVTIWLQANSHQTKLHLGQVNKKLVKTPQNILIKKNSEEEVGLGVLSL